MDNDKIWLKRSVIIHKYIQLSDVSNTYYLAFYEIHPLKL